MDNKLTETGSSNRRVAAVPIWVKPYLTIEEAAEYTGIKQFVALYEIVMISSFWEVIIRRFYFRTLAAILLDMGDFLSGRISNRVVGLLYCKTF